MDENVRPGDHILKETFGFKAKKFFSALGRGICLLLASIIIYPFLLVFGLPVMLAIAADERHHMVGLGRGRFFRTILSLLSFCLGLVLNICFIPAALIGTACLIVAVIIRGTIDFVKWLKRPPTPIRERDSEQDFVRLRAMTLNVKRA